MVDCLEKTGSEATVQRLILVVLVLIAATLACNLISEDTITENERLVRSDRPALILLAPQNGDRYADGTQILFHVMVTDVVGISRIEVIINLPGDETVLTQTVDPPGQNIEAIIPWLPPGVGDYLVSVYAYRPEGDSNDPLDDVPSNEGLVLVKVVPPPGSSPVAPTPEPTIPDIAGVPARVDGTVPVPVRQGPGTTYANVQELVPGTEVEVVGRSEDMLWLVIRLPSGFGWVFRDTIAIEADISDLPLVEAPAQ